MAREGSFLRGLASALSPAVFQADQQRLAQQQRRDDLSRQQMGERILDGIQRGLIPQEEGAAALQKLGGFDAMLSRDSSPPPELAPFGGGPPETAPLGTIVSPQPAKSGFGDSQKERALKIVLDAKNFIDQGGQLTPEQAREVEGARFLLETTNTAFKTGPGGELRLETTQRQLPEALQIGQKKQPESKVIRQKSLSSKDRDNLITRKEMTDKLAGLAGNFRDEFTGFVSDIAGEAAIGFRKRFGDDASFNDWWQSYQDFVNEVRHEKFGAALTATEKREFLKAMITPGTKPELARRNLQRQMDVAQKGLSRKAGALEAGSFNVEEIQAIIGPQAPQQAIQAPPGVDPASFNNLSREEQQELMELLERRGGR